VRLLVYIIIILYSCIRLCKKPKLQKNNIIVYVQCTPIVKWYSVIVGRIFFLISLQHYSIIRFISCKNYDWQSHHGQVIFN